MRPARLFLALVSLYLSTASAAQTVAVPPQTLTIEGAVAHLYKSIGGTELRLHVFSPPNHSAAAPKPAILFFFGGAWTNGNVGQFVPQSKHLAQRGMVAIVVDYRVFARHMTSPFEALADAKSAIRWVRAHARELGVDPNRIAAGGGSSGGHLALSSGVFDVFDEVGEDGNISSKPNALILFNPAVNTAQETPVRLKERFGDRAREASPLHHVRRGLPPTVIFHGTADAVIPYADVEQFCREATRLGNQCQLVGYEGATHGFFNPTRDGGKWFAATLLEMDRFLTKTGFLPAPQPPAAKASRTRPQPDSLARTTSITFRPDGSTPKAARAPASTTVSPSTRTLNSP